MEQKGQNARSRKMNAGGVRIRGNQYRMVYLLSVGEVQPVHSTALVEMRVPSAELRRIDNLIVIQTKEVS
jgi:arginine repressor